MANNIAFQPMGKTYKCNTTTTTQTITVSADSPVNQYMFISHEPTGWCWITCVCKNFYFIISNCCIAW
jgi:phosphohistidine phosphatase SixA